MARQTTPGPVPVPTPAEIPGFDAAASSAAPVQSVNGQTGAVVTGTDPITALGTVSVNTAIDLSTGGVYTMALAADVTISATGMQAGKSAVVQVKITASGARVLAFPAWWLWTGDKPVALADGLSGTLLLTNAGAAAADVIAAWLPLGAG